MSARVTVVDYGLGNLFSIRRALTHLGALVEMTDRAEDIQRASRLILPGVGAFGDGMQRLRAKQLIEPLQDVVRTQRPLLGICLGMQLFFTESEEFGRHEGLGFLEGRVNRLCEQTTDGRQVKVPHVGWENLQRPAARAHWEATVLAGVEEGGAMYFVHSYVPVPIRDDVLLAHFTYGGHRYCAAVEQGNLIGFQCHPEKSGVVGLQVLRNFLTR